MVFVVIVMERFYTENQGLSNIPINKQNLVIRKSKNNFKEIKKVYIE